MRELLALWLLKWCTVCIRTRLGIYGQRYPLPAGVPSGTPSDTVYRYSTYLETAGSRYRYRYSLYLETAGSMDHQCGVRQAVFFRSSCHHGCTVLAIREGWRVACDLLPQEAPDNSWCWVFVYLYNVVIKLLLGEKNLEAGDSGEGDKWQKGPSGIWPTCPPPPPGCPPLYLTSSSPPSPTHHHHPPSSPRNPPPAPPL